jgi:hypothetical protein
MFIYFIYIKMAQSTIKIHYQSNISVLLEFFPKDVSELIYGYIINQYKYKYSLYHLELFDTMYFSKQLGFICYSSDNSHGIIDYYTGKQRKSSLIDIKNIIHSDDAEIICNNNNIVTKYILSDDKYKLTNTLNLNSNEDKHIELKINDISICVYNECIYVCHEIEHHDYTYYITIYDLKSLRKIKNTSFCYYLENSYAYIKDKIQISIYDDIIYINKPRSIYSSYVYRHNINTLQIIDVRMLVCYNSFLITKLHNDRVYNYVSDKIIVYSLVTLNKLYAINIRPFKIPNQDHCLSISNDMMMISNGTEMMFYKMKC